MTDDTPQLLLNGPGLTAHTVALAHGAGAAMDSPFMNAMAEGLAGRDMRVARFEFPYMAARREGASKRAPNREAVLRETWLHVIAALGTERLVIGGKSMGGRIASLVADEVGVKGLVCLGYPFHPAGKPDQLRVAHLRTLRTPTLIVQGERDAFGNREEVGGYSLSSAIRIHWIADGDHSLKPRQKSGRTQQQNWQEVIQVVADFVNDLPDTGHHHARTV